ncbi:MAG: hypothetical protein V1718_01820, partial [archaeon]
IKLFDIIFSVKYREFRLNRCFCVFLWKLFSKSYLKVLKVIILILFMATAPDCNKNSQRARMRRVCHLEHNKVEEEWAKKLKSSKYPRCVGTNLFDDCPTEITDTISSTCKSCPQYVPSVDDKKERMRKLMEEMKKK